MAIWAHVTNNTVDELHDLLPRSWKNISGLRNAETNEEYLNSVGWYKIIKDLQQFDPRFYSIDRYDYQFTNNSVVEQIILLEREEPLPDENSFEQQKIRFMADLRAERNRRISESDWTQLPDSPVNKSEWEVYRQSLRDLPSVYENDETVLPEEIIWPLAPA